MDYMNDILARLQRGETVDALASELTKAINEAQNRYVAEQEAKRKAEQEAKMKAAAEEAKRNDKVKAIKDLISAFENVLIEWEISDSGMLNEIDIEELVDELDRAVPALQEYMNLMNSLKPAKAPTGGRSMKTAPDLPAAGDPIEKFLNQFVR